MADTFKGIITADGKKRRLPYDAVLDRPVSDTTFSKEGGFADSKAVGDKFSKVDSETASIKEDLNNNRIIGIKEILSDKTFVIKEITGAISVNSINGNTINANATQSSCIGIKTPDNTFVTGHKYRIVLELSHDYGADKSFAGVSFNNNIVNNWKVFSSIIVLPGITVKSIVDYVATHDGTLGIYCYGGNANVNITVKIYDITNIDVDNVSKIAFSSANYDVYYNHADYADHAKIADMVAESENDIVCWGDSLTYGYGATHGVTDYPTILAKLTGKTVHNMGISGEPSDTICARQGGYNALVNPTTIPQDTTAVELSFNEGLNIGNTTRIGEKGSLDIINPVSLCGVSGNISYSDEKFYFTRLARGNDVTFTHPMPVICANSVERKNDIQIIFMGTNGGWMITADNAETRISKLISQIDAMIAYSDNQNFIVVGMHYFYSWVLYNGLTKEMLETALLYKYGRRYINLRDYMVNYGLADAKITPTEEDTTAIANGEVPPSLLFTDKIHGNVKFYELLAKQVYERGQELKYWN